jgi:hypothetical protein
MGGVEMPAAQDRHLIDQPTLDCLTTTRHHRNEWQEQQRAVGVID